ncbi:GNAT family N-acetyltransferase [Paenibacillus methanolicus]|uniref:Ribosomal-protein-alanine N-acetyltransferase n=1 Tax=Paenibacillus methanolicus TaxID=582686 RepID=A0A5S5C616_9BACL|nr:GNAT family N-acetyltransferase [Paenibacillus methanolicus]TYP73770.1 ribosomal-protein-alanine N-acetyltransferase [Paenibacillus methanolicus]
MHMRTERLILREIEECDAEAVLDYVRRNRDFLESWEARRQEDYYTLDAQVELLRQDAARSARGEQVKAWLSPADETAKVVGSVTISNIVRGAFLSCHLGYRLDEAYANRGLMTEALQAMIRHAFDELGLHRIEANIMPRNAASLGVVRKLGFYEEGLALKYLFINGCWEDHLHMVLRNAAME